MSQQLSEIQQQQIVSQYQQMRDEIQQIAQKITEFEGELHEHNLVIKTLEGVDADRRCFRQVGDVLAERSVKEVLPAVTKNRDAILDLSQKLAKDLEEKQKMTQDFAKKYKIEMKSPEEMMEEKRRNSAQQDQKDASSSKKEGGSGGGAGVLI